MNWTQILSNSANSVQQSLTRRLFDLASQYDDVINLTLGDPDVIPSRTIREAACQAIQDGKTRYSANAGLWELRQAICEDVAISHKLQYQPNNVIVTVGGMGALYLVFLSIVNAGDEVIMASPGWVNYGQMVKMCGGLPIVVPTKEEDGFAIQPDAFDAVITPRTKAIVLTTPCNPTGEILSKEALIALADIAKRHQILVIADEVYAALAYDGHEVYSIATLPGMQAQTVLINSFSKKFSMTGYRVGYAVADEELIQNMTKLQENISACAPLPSQYAALACLKAVTQEEIAHMVEIFKQRRDIVVEEINNIPNLSCRVPQGTFYAFVNIQKSGMTSLEFAMALLEEEHVAVVPGITYGKEGDHYIRIACTISEDLIREGLKRIRQFMYRERTM